MGLFGRLFTKEKVTKEVPKTEKKQSEWQTLSAYIPAEKSEYEIVSLIATAIAAGNKPESQFFIKRISKRNPEAQLVSVVATSIAAASKPESQFIIRSIKEKKNQEEDKHVAKI